MTKLDHALALAAEGFHVFPCVAGSKRPAVKFKEWATRDESTIRATWSITPDLNIGIYTGKFAEGEALLVVDVDVKKGKDGNDALLALELEGCELAHTRTATTASGGRHLYYRVPEPLRQGANVIGVGLDIRSRGGYVLGPGSTIGDAVYHFDCAAPLALAPGWLSARCGDGVRERVEPPSAPVAGVDREHSYDLALRYLRSHAPLAVEGSAGDETTYKVACRVRDFGVPLADAVELMAEHWNGNCSPPWPHDELAEKVANAYRYGVNPPGAALPQADFTPVKPPRKARYELFHEIKPDLLRPALVAGWLDCDAFSVMYGPPGSAKSFNAINLGFCVARGEAWFGCKTHQGGVVYLALEGGAGVKRRIEALRRHHATGDTVIPFAVARGPVDLSATGTSMQELHDLMVEARAEMGCPIALLIVDTFARANIAGDENSAKDMGVVIGKLDKLRAEFGCHVMALHHSGKDVDRGMRGSNALLGAVDTAILVRDDTISVPDGETGKQRDRGKGAAIGFKLVDVTIGEDAEGNLITSAVVVEAPEMASRVRPKPLTAKAMTFLHALHDAGGRSKKAWYDMCRQRGLLSNSPDTARSQLSRYTLELTAAGLILVDGDAVTVLG